MRNIELKARCGDLAAAHQVARSLSATLLATEQQHDTYFLAAHGRLKLRQRRIDGVAQPSELIGYRRADEARSRASEYTLIPTDHGEALRALLRDALGVVVEVRKERTVYLHDRVRIHLDQVEGLGAFIEFEALVDATCDDATAHAKLDRLHAAFAIAPEQIERGSYADLRQYP